MAKGASGAPRTGRKILEMGLRRIRNPESKHSFLIAEKILRFSGISIFRFRPGSHDEACVYCKACFFALDKTQYFVLPLRHETEVQETETKEHGKQLAYVR